MTDKTCLYFLFVAGLFFFGCQIDKDNGKLILVNESDKPFYYKLEVKEKMTNRTYRFNPDSTDFPLLNIAESDTIDISDQYSDDDKVNIYIFVKDTVRNIAEWVRGESVGIKFLNNTMWAPVVIENL